MKPGPQKLYDTQIRFDVDAARKVKLYAISRERAISVPVLLRQFIDSLPEPKRAETEAAE